jgi:hypothetical protein
VHIVTKDGKGQLLKANCSPAEAWAAAKEWEAAQAAKVQTAKNVCPKK